jgi:hypothetical protein
MVEEKNYGRIRYLGKIITPLKIEILGGWREGTAVSGDGHSSDDVIEFTGPKRYRWKHTSTRKQRAEAKGELEAFLSSPDPKARKIARERLEYAESEEANLRRYNRKRALKWGIGLGVTGLVAYLLFR